MNKRDIMQGMRAGWRGGRGGGNRRRGFIGNGEKEGGVSRGVQGGPPTPHPLVNVVVNLVDVPPLAPGRESRVRPIRHYDWGK